MTDLVVPPFFRQEGPSTCGIAVLRMALAAHGKKRTERELLDHLRDDYDADFQNLWNPSVAKVALRQGMPVAFMALWPLFTPALLTEALHEFATDPASMDTNKYENPDDSDSLPEPLSLSYRHMLEAVQLGCTVGYGGLTHRRLRAAVNSGGLVQVTVRLHRLYDDARPAFHNLLVYAVDGDTVRYHDPNRQAEMSTTWSRLSASLPEVRAFLTYGGR